METPETIRQKIDDLIKNTDGVDYASLSVLLGKNPAYIHQYIKRGSPKVLSDGHRKIIATRLGVSETELMTDEQKVQEQKIAIISKNTSASADSVSIEVIDARACCGNGVENFAENVVGFWQMPKEEYRAISTIAPENIKMLRVFGDSMEPTLSDGDWVLVDISRNFFDSDGIFLIRLSTGLAVKRIQGTLGTDVVICSDNAKYKPITASAREVVIVGKVIYTLKAEKVG